MEQRSYITPQVVGIDIIPTDDVAPGCKRTDTYAVLVNPANYETLRTMTAKGVLVVLALLKEEFDDE